MPDLPELVIYQLKVVRLGISPMIWGRQRDRYEGEFRDDKRNGKGVLTFANGDQQEGIWIDDKLVKPEKIE